MNDNQLLMKIKCPCKRMIHACVLSLPIYVTAVFETRADDASSAGDSAKAVPPWKVNYNIPDLTQRAARGDGRAQRVLAELYLQGDEVPRDHERSLGFARQAADGGSAAGMCRLGQLYANGIGEPRHAGETPFALHMKAAEKGFTESMAELARRYRYGYGVEQDYLECCKWMLLGGLPGLAFSSNGDFLESDGSPTKTADPELALIAGLLSTYKQALEKRSPQAIRQIAEFYESGIYGPKNPKMAARFRKGDLPTSEAFRFGLDQ